MSVRLYTNHGRRLIAQAKQNDVKAPGKVEKDGVLYERVQTTHTDCPISKGTLKGFFGRADETTSQAGGILRLGIVWGDVLKALPALGAEADAPAQAYDYLGQADRDDVDSAQRMLAEKNSNEIAVMQSELSRKDKALQETITAMNEKERALQKVLNQSPVVVAAQSGTARPSNWVDDKRDNGDLSRIKFSSPLLQPPRLLYGLSHVDQQAQERFTLRSEAIDITCEAFTLNTFTAGGARSYKPTSHWLTLPENDIHFETGISDTYDRTRSDNNQMVSSRVSFSRHFKSTPSVVSWLYEVNIANGWRSLRTDAVNVDSNHFDLRIHTWANRNMDGARAGWVAIDDNGCKARAKTGSVTVSRAERDKFEHVEFGGPAFSKTPAVFIALAELDAGEGQNTRLRGEVTSVTETGFQFTYGTWAGANDHNMDHARWIWVAAE